MGISPRRALAIVRVGTALIVQLSAGVYLIHWGAGWFLVGAGRNGTEFSALLILCLLAIALAPPFSTN